jgi:hypothetical protein
MTTPNPSDPGLPSSVNMSPEERPDVGGRERRLLAKYPLHICLMVQAAAKALEEGRAEIRDGVLVLRPTEDCSQKGLDSRANTL